MTKRRMDGDEMSLSPELGVIGPGAVVPGRKKALKASDILSCTACRARKTRCSKGSPCDYCVKRGRPLECTPDLRKYPASFGSVSEQTDELRGRLNRLEDFIAAQFPDEFDLRGGEPGGGVQPALDRSSLPADPGALAGSQAAPSAEEALAAILANEGMHDSDLASSLRPAHQLPLPPCMPSVSDAPGLYQSIFARPREPDALWERPLLLTLLGNLPSASVLRQLARTFLLNVNWQIPVVNRPQLVAELNELESGAAVGLLESVDPAWLAVAFFVAALGLVAELDLKEDVEDSLMESELRKMAGGWARAGQGALAAADCMGTPSMRIVQALVLERCWLGNAYTLFGQAGVSTPTQIEARLAVARQQCRALGLDMLGADPAKMPAPDVATTSAPSGLRRQTGLRLWEGFLWLEISSNVLVDSPGSWNSELPVLCDDDQLGWALECLPPPVHQYPQQIVQRVWRVMLGGTRSFMQGRARGGLSSSEIKSLEKNVHDKVQELLKDIEACPSFVPPSCFPTLAEYKQHILILETCNAMRLHRAACKSSAGGVAGKGQAHFIRARDLSVQAIALFETISVKRVFVGVPLFSVLLSSACVVLGVAVFGYGDTSSNVRQALMDGIDLLQACTTCRAESVAAVARQRLDVLRALATHLVQSRPSPTASHAAIHKKLSLPTNQDYESVFDGYLLGPWEDILSGSPGDAGSNFFTDLLYPMDTGSST